MVQLRWHQYRNYVTAADIHAYLDANPTCYLTPMEVKKRLVNETSLKLQLSYDGINWHNIPAICEHHPTNI